MKKKNLNNTETSKFAIGAKIIDYHYDDDGNMIVDKYEIQELSLTKLPKPKPTAHYCSAECRIS